MRPMVSQKLACVLMSFGFPPAFRSSILLLSLGALAGCSSGAATQRYASLGSGQIDPRYGVRASPRVVADGDEVPAGGGRYHVGKPYQIAGHTYYPSEKPVVQIGAASWYGSDFHGRRTANGEIFDRGSISAAHPTMPLPSYARVTNLRNDHSIIVRVNDRGPYHGGRVMDVSQRVAEALDFQSAGIAKVKVEWIGRADLGGDSASRLLATLRTDGAPASFGEDAPPVMTAEREAPAPTKTASRSRRHAAPQTDAPEKSAAPSETMAYAAEPQGESVAPRAAETAERPTPLEEPPPATAAADPEPVSAIEKAAPTPPARPQLVGGRHVKGAAKAKDAIRQALN